ncbi:MAG: endolytic transglycosylase MltG [Aeromonas sp.]
MKFNRLTLLSAGALLGLSCASYIGYQWHTLEQLTVVGPTRLFEVPKGAHASGLMQTLSEQPVSGWASRLWLRFNSDLLQVKSGTFEITEGQTVKSALAQFASGKEFLFHITLVEGARFTDWQQQLQNAPHLIREIKNLSDAEIGKKLGMAHGQLEGWFLPETYAYTPSASDLSILRRANVSMQEVLQSQWEQRQSDLPYKNAYEALIMASIIEKETGIAHERKMIASVFINRLRKGMKLQTDPTVIYGVKDRYDGNIRKRDLLDNNPYNTYVINGLPPTPIAMPSRAAIEAALNPASTEYYYFVAKGGGEHHFSKTLKEHNRAVRTYILNKN